MKGFEWPVTHPTWCTESLSTTSTPLCLMGKLAATADAATTEEEMETGLTARRARESTASAAYIYIDLFYCNSKRWTDFSEKTLFFIYAL